MYIFIIIFYFIHKNFSTFYTTSLIVIMYCAKFRCYNFRLFCISYRHYTNILWYLYAFSF